MDFLFLSGGKIMTFTETTFRKTVKAEIGKLGENEVSEGVMEMVLRSMLG